MQNSTIFRQLILNIILPVCAGLIILAVYNIYHIQNKLSKVYYTKNQIITNEIKHIMEFQDLALEIHEELLEKKLKNYSHIIINKYFPNTNDIEKSDLDKIRGELGMDPDLEDIYIIDRNGIVVNTTFDKDYQLNFFNFGEEHKKYLLEIFENGKFKNERFTIEARTRRLRKYTYQPTTDGKYIVELGTYSEKTDEIIEFIKNHLNRLAKESLLIEENPVIKSVDLFIVADAPFSLNRDAIVIKEHKDYLDAVFENKTKIQVVYNEEGEKLHFDYIYLDIRNTDLYKGAVIRIISDRSYEKGIIRAELIKIIMLFVLTSFLIFLLIYKKSKDITAPIYRLAKNIKHISEGNYNERALIDGNKEVAELSEQFNLMIEKIEARNKETAEQHEEIEAQKQQLIKTNKDLEKLSLVASKTNNAVSIYDKKGKLQWFNDGFERLYGYTFNEVYYNIGENITEINENPDIENLLKICLKTKQPVEFETCCYNKSSQNLWIQTTLTPIVNDKNEVTGFIAIDTNISTIKYVEKKLKEKNKDITDSIYYAKRIQEAVLYPVDKIKTRFNGLFILLKPKSIVSGDFYWYFENGESAIIAAADCTGHGIPGAFMSIIGSSLLNKIVKDDNIEEPAEILTKLRENISKILTGDEDIPISKDGIDMALCKYNFNNNLLEFAGSFNPVYVISHNEIKIPENILKAKISKNSSILYEIKPDRYPIGISEKKEKFTTKKVQLIPGDKFYLFTDGFADQFGGEFDKKFKYNNFKNLILEIHGLDLKKQKKLLNNKFDEWKGENDQIDDLLIIGVQI